MANGKKGIALGIIAIVIGVSGLGLGTYTAIKFQVVEGPPGLDGTDGVNGTLDNLVAIWESLSGYGAPSATFHVALGDMILNNDEYFSLSASNTSVNLTTAGWYRFTIRLLWEGLLAAFAYKLEIEKNGALLETPVRIDNWLDTYYHVMAVVYVYSDGNDTFKLRCISGGATFDIYTTGQDYNQVVVEYVGES